MDGAAFGESIVEIVKGYVARSLAALGDRVDALQRRLDALPVPRDGKDADPAEIARMVDAEVERRIDEIAERAAGLVPRDKPEPVERIIGEQIEAAIPEILRRAVEAIPRPQDGKDGADVDMNAVETMIDERIEALVPAVASRAAEAIPRPADGKDADVDEVVAKVLGALVPKLDDLGEELRERAVPGRDGKDGEPGRAGEKGEPGPQGEKGDPGDDGVGVAGALIDRDGILTLTLSDGSIKCLGPVVGRDGTAGEPGRPGADGTDGRDGFGFDDLSVVHDGERGLTLRFERGEQVREFPVALPAMIYRGVYKADSAYSRGDTVTWGGSLWHCDEETTERPGEGTAWTLAAKRGRDGKAGEPGKKGDPGKPGRDGRDLTQLGPDGSRW